ncbi:hypothetical protein ACWFPY_24800 [Nocardia fluminea]
MFNTGKSIERAEVTRDTVSMGLDDIGQFRVLMALAENPHAW